MSLTSPEVCRRTGATYRELDYWARVGYVRPETTPCDPSGKPRPERSGRMPGSGMVRVWSSAEAAVVERMVRLVRAGLKPSVAASVARGEMVIGPGIAVVMP